MTDFGDVAAAVLRAAREWQSRPTKWRRLAAELLVVLTQLRPVVYLDDIAIEDLTSLEAFLRRLNGTLARRIVALSVDGDSDDREFSSLATVFLADADSVAARDKARPAFVTPSPSVLDDDTSHKLHVRMDRILDQIVEKLREGCLRVRLASICSVAEMPTLAGCLLGYPVVYVPYLGVPSHCDTDCTLYRVCTTRAVLPKPLFTFSVPIAVSAVASVQAALQCWEKELYDKHLDDWSIQTETRSFVLRF